MTPEILNFIPGSLAETDKYIKVTDGTFVTAKQTGWVQIKMCDDNEKPFIAMLYNVQLAPDLCDQLFSIITLINLGHYCLFHKGICTVFFSDNEQKAVTLLHRTQRKHEYLVKTKEKSKSQKQIPIRKVYSELLYQRLGHTSTRSLLSGNNANIWQAIDIRIDVYPFCT